MHLDCFVAEIVIGLGHFGPNPNAQPLGGNESLKNDSFWEVYGKATYTFNDQWAVGVQEWYSPSVVNTRRLGLFLHRQRHLWTEGAALFSRDHRPTEANWRQEEPVDKAKPFDIPKQEVWELL